MSNSLQSDAAISPATISLRGRSTLAPTLFGAIAIDVRERLLRDAPTREVAAGQIIQQRGETSAGFWVIERGRVKIGQYRSNGEFRGLALLAEGDSYGELALLAGNARAVDAVADGPARLRWIAGTDFEQALASDPTSLRKLAGALAEELQEVLETLAGTGSTDSYSRVIAMLANLAGAGDGPAEIALGQQELGELLGLTRATVNKALACLENDGLIARGYRRITLLDRPALRRAMSD